MAPDVASDGDGGRPIVGGAARAVPTFAEILEAEAARGRAAVDRPPPPPRGPADPLAGEIPPAAPVQRSARGAVARVGRALKVTAYTIAGLFGLLLFIGFVFGEDTVEDSGEGAFAAVDPAACRELVLTGEDFTPGQATTTELEGTGLGTPAWGAPLAGSDGALRIPVPIAGDGSERVTIAYAASDADGDITTHAATYDITSGELVDQVHLRAVQLGSVPGARWHVGVSGDSALLFPVVDAEIPACFAASAAPDAPAPPLTFEADGRIRPDGGAVGQTAVTEHGLHVVRRDRFDGAVQRLGVDGEVEEHDVDAADAIYSDGRQVYVLSYQLDGQQLTGHDPRTMEQHWDVLLDDAPDLYTPTFASDGTVVTLVSRLSRRRLVRVAAADGELFPLGEARVTASTGGSDGTVTYLVEPNPEGQRESAVHALASDDDAVPIDLAPSGLVEGVAVGSSTPDALVVSAPPAMGGLQGLVLRGGEVASSAHAALLGLGADHVIAMLTLPDGEQVLLGVPLAAPADGSDEGEHEEDGGGGDGDGDGEDSDSEDSGDGSDGGGGAGAGGGGQGRSSGAGGGSDVTEGADIDEGWLP